MKKTTLSPIFALQPQDHEKKGICDTMASLPVVTAGFWKSYNQTDHATHPFKPGTQTINPPEKMIQSVLHPASTRGFADHGWLKSYHTFSFSSYHNPERMNFGMLRVLNDDTVEAGMGFGKHPHDNMEIVSIPLEGDLEHQDSMGNKAIIRSGDIQVMSAGTGITHSEYNHSKDKRVKFLQIWVFPNKKNVQPRYDQVTLKSEDRLNKLQLVVSPQEGDPGVWVHQDAWFHLGKLKSGFETEYTWKKKGNGLYAFVLSGDINIGQQALHTRDGYGVWNTESVTIRAGTDAELLLMEVPMNA